MELSLEERVVNLEKTAPWVGRNLDPLRARLEALAQRVQALGHHLERPVVLAEVSPKDDLDGMLDKVVAGLEAESTDAPLVKITADLLRLLAQDRKEYRAGR